MSELNTTQLQAHLKAAGWRIDKKPTQDTMDKCDWYAWQPTCPDDWPDCEGNNRPPSLVITPTVFDMPGSVTFSLRGQMGGQWYDLRLYSVPIDDAIQTIDKATSSLGAAWKAIAQMENHMTTEQPEALRLAEILEGDYCQEWFYEQGVDEVSAELLRQHTRIAELEAQLEAIGAGGVEPLRRISELLAERDALAAEVDRLAEALRGWWKARRPAGWTEDQHRSCPHVNLATNAEKALADAMLKAREASND